MPRGEEPDTETTIARRPSRWSALPGADLSYSCRRRIVLASSAKAPLPRRVDAGNSRPLAPASEAARDAHGWALNAPYSSCSIVVSLPFEFLSVMASHDTKICSERHINHSTIPASRKVFARLLFLRADDCPWRSSARSFLPRTLSTRAPSVPTACTALRCG